VTTPGYYFNSENKGVLHIDVKDKSTNNFDGIIGYIPPSNENEEGVFNGFIKIGLRNIFGTEREALFRWQKEGRDIQELEISYLEPWIFGFPLNIRAGLYQRQQDTTYIQRNLSGYLEFLATDVFSASLLLKTESTIPSITDSGTFTVYNSDAIETGANIKIDSRDNIYAPTEGIFFLSSYKFSTKKINGPEEFITPETITEDDLQRLELDFLYFFQLMNRQVLSFGIHGRELTGNYIEESDLYRLGGTNTLRGYKENQFLGNRMLWTNLEYRYLLSRQSYAFLFFDAAYYLRNEDESRNIDRIAEFEYGYGLGMTFETALGIMGVSFALGKDDAISEGKIHVGIISEF
jgi:outer membrane protein insertion porin family